MGHKNRDSWNGIEYSIETKYMPDGNQVRTYPNGSQVVRYPDNRMEVVRQNGKRTRIEAPRMSEARFQEFWNEYRKGGFRAYNPDED